MDKKILFLTGTRADFGKIKSLIQAVENDEDLSAFVFVTGMHMQYDYGLTLLEVERCKFSNIHTFQNFTHETTMDLSLAKTIEGLSVYVQEINPDLIVVHGDRVETLAGAIVGSLNNILVAHIEGGELSGTVDELIRHSVSKLSHIHFVSNAAAAQRLKQMGEMDSSIFEIGSPDVDIMFSDNLPDIQSVLKYYEIPFEEYGILLFHPVTTEFEKIEEQVNILVKTIIEDNYPYVVIYPNNDLGSSRILKAYNRLKDLEKIRLIPSLRFEYFLTLLKNSKFIIGNSSAGIREAPYYGVPVINIGSRQRNRCENPDIINVNFEYSKILSSLSRVRQMKRPDISNKIFGTGDSTLQFLESIKTEEFWNIDHQKQFRDLTNPHSD
ncbi:UDP-N-acetylglucosamine 2-epimerase [Salegentibacter sp. HM20]